MKPSIPDTGTILRLENGHAVIGMNGHESCRKCGAAAIGLCKGGMMQVVTARNRMGARAGAVVRIGLVQKVQYRGYVLAYVVPSFGLVLGAVAGHVLGAAAGFPHLDIIAGLIALIAVSFVSLGRLKRLGSASSIEVVEVLAGPRDPGLPGMDSASLPEEYQAYFPEEKKGQVPSAWPGYRTDAA